MNFQNKLLQPLLMTRFLNAQTVYLFSFVVLALGRVRAEEPSRFVHTQVGELPIIVSAPHGGALEVPDVPPRKGEGLEKGPSGYFTGRDVGTEELAEQV